MSQFNTEVICLITMEEREDGTRVYGAVAPDAMYSLVDTPQLNDSWELCADTVAAQTGCDVIGAVVRTDMPETPTDQDGAA